MRFEAPTTGAGQGGGFILPAVIAQAGRAGRRFIEFFTANIQNRTRGRPTPERLRGSSLVRRTGLELARSSLLWSRPTSRSFPDFPPDRETAPSRNPHALRLACHRQVMSSNPAASVRGPKHVVRKGRTPVLRPTRRGRSSTASRFPGTKTGRRPLSSSAFETEPSSRVMVYSFARVGATLAMRVEDYYPEGRRGWFRLHEKGGKLHSVPAHHNAEAYLDAYLEAAGIAEDRKGPLFSTIDNRRKLTQPR